MKKEIKLIFCKPTAHEKIALTQFIVDIFAKIGIIIGATRGADFVEKLIEDQVIPQFGKGGFTIGSIITAYHAMTYGALGYLFANSIIYLGDDFIDSINHYLCRNEIEPSGEIYQYD
ncbi:MAG: hypothetical protein AABY27_03785 [Pseudomonadota bacterium]